MIPVVIAGILLLLILKSHNKKTQVKSSPVQHSNLYLRGDEQPDNSHLSEEIKFYFKNTNFKKELTAQCLEKMIPFFNDLVRATNQYNSAMGTNYTWWIYRIGESGPRMKGHPHRYNIAVDVHLSNGGEHYALLSKWEDKKWQPLEILRSVAEEHDLMWGGISSGFPGYPFGDVVHVQCSPYNEGHADRWYKKLKPTNAYHAEWDGKQLKLNR